jgi:hypothetical protein
MLDFQLGRNSFALDHRLLRFSYKRRNEVYRMLQLITFKCQQMAGHVERRTQCSVLDANLFLPSNRQHT